MAGRTNYQQILGCDVAKDSVVIFDSLGGTIRTVDNKPKALRQTLAALATGPAAGTLVVCEATGGHEARLLEAALQAGLAAHRADPRKAHSFARSLRSEGKSDSIDARGLAMPGIWARYGLERGDELPLWQPPTPAQQALRQLVRLRVDLTQARADFCRRLEAPDSGRPARDPTNATSSSSSRASTGASRPSRPTSTACSPRTPACSGSSR